MFALLPLLFPSRGCGKRALTSECKIDQGNYTARMFFLRSDLMEDIRSKTETFSGNTKNLSSTWNSSIAKKKSFRCGCFNMVDRIVHLHWKQVNLKKLLKKYGKHGQRETVLWNSILRFNFLSFPFPFSFFGGEGCRVGLVERQYGTQQTCKTLENNI